MELNQKLKDQVINIGYDVESCKNLQQLADLIPVKYIFIEQRLWCGNLYVDADDYDYPNAILNMLIKLNRLSHENN